MIIQFQKDEKTIWLIPVNDDKPVVFYYDSVRINDLCDGKFEVSQQVSICEFLNKVKAAGVDDPNKKLEELLSRGKCTATIV